MDDKKMPETAADVLRKVLANTQSPLGQQFGRWRLWAFWEKVVGSELAQTTMPVDYQRGFLIVHVSSACQIQDLDFMKTELKTRINQFLGYTWVRGLRFTTHRHEVPKENEEANGLKEFLSHIPE